MDGIYSQDWMKSQRKGEKAKREDLGNKVVRHEQETRTCDRVTRKIKEPSDEALKPTGRKGWKRENTLNS